MEVSLCFVFLVDGFSVDVANRRGCKSPCLELKSLSQTRDSADVSMWVEGYLEVRSIC